MPHIHDKIDFTVEVFVVYRNKVLLRKHDKLKKWLGVGGHIELDEDPVQAAIREVKEEVGLNIQLDSTLKPKYNLGTGDLIPPYYLNRHKISKTHEHIALVYFARSKKNKIKQGKTEKSEACKWLTKKEIEKNKEITPTIKFYALKALENLK